MTLLIQRPDYIEYYWGDDESKKMTTMSYIKKLESEEEIFKWEMPHCFTHYKTAFRFHLEAIAILWLPYLFLVYYGVHSHMTMDVEWFCDGDLLILFAGAILLISYGLIYYLTRSYYDHKVYRISESGILEDSLKLLPKFAYGKQDTSQFVYIMRWLSVPVIILAFFVHPLLLAGAGGMIFYSFRPIEVSESESAYYLPFMWTRPELNKKYEHNKMDITRLRITPERYIIRLKSENAQLSIHLYCKPVNYEAIKNFLYKTLPNIRADGAAYY
jgi:hypothetical protein